MQPQLGRSSGAVGNTTQMPKVPGLNPIIVNLNRKITV